MVVCGFDIGMVTGLNLDRHELNFFFIRISFGLNMKGQRKP